jgi:GMP synthase (glutamine-hydrolysing)
MDKELVIVIDFGGQYNQLVARRVRECNVYCEIYSYRTPIEKIREMKPKGIILTGGPNSCYEEGAPGCDRALFEMGIPVLGLCYGAQLMQHVLGGKVEKAQAREYGKTEVFVNSASPLFKGVGLMTDSVPKPVIPFEGQENDNKKTICWMSHFDYISDIAPGFEVIAHTADCPVAAAQNTAKKLYLIQFHPEVVHTIEGGRILHNFVHSICACSGTWRMDSFVDSAVREIKEKVGDGRVLLALSGGVDSSVAAGLISRAIGKQLTCVFVDHGLLRKNEGDEVEAIFGEEGDFDLNFVRVNAADRYFEKLKGVSEPENKRKIIGEEFIRIFEEEAKKIGAVEYLAQGTIYPDVVESGLGGESAVIKSHHNVGGLPDYVDFKEILEPLRNLFKDEVRKVGLQLGLPGSLVFRQPFPGPGLGIRIIGEVTAEKVRIVQDADAIYREEIDRAVREYRENIANEKMAYGSAFASGISSGPFAGGVSGKSGERIYARTDVLSSERRRAGEENKTASTTVKENPPWMPDQYFAALSNMQSVGVMGDERTYDYAVVLRAVQTVDFMTAQMAQIPWEVLGRTMNRIINEVRGVNRCLYDLTSKPPGTVELE